MQREGEFAWPARIKRKFWKRAPVENPGGIAVWRLGSPGREIDPSQEDVVMRDNGILTSYYAPIVWRGEIQFAPRSLSRAQSEAFGA